MNGAEFFRIVKNLKFSVINIKQILSNPKFTPDVYVKETGPHSITIGWSIKPEVEMRKKMHYYNVVMKNESDHKETVVNSGFNYEFTNLDSATNYSFQVNYT